MLGKPEIIGVDIGQYSVKIARIKQSGKTFVANHLSYDVIPAEVREQRDKATLEKIVTTALKKQKISKGRPVIHINTGDAIMREITIDPSFRGYELEGQMEVSLGEGLPFGIDQVYYDFDEVPEKDGTRLAVAVRHEVVDEKIALLGRLPKSFDSIQVDVDAFAFTRVLEYVLKNDATMEKNDRVMLIDIGFSRSRFYVCQKGKLVFSREQQIGGNTVNEIITDVFDIDNHSAENRKLSQGFGDEYHDLVLNPYVHTFSEQLNLALDFYEANNTDQEPLKTIFLTGGGSRLSGFSDALNAENPHDIRLLDLSSYIKLSNAQRNDDSLYSGINHALAIGLAMDGTN